MAYVLIHQSLFVRINHSDELSVWRIKHSQLYIQVGALPVLVPSIVIWKYNYVTHGTYWNKETVEHLTSTGRPDVSVRLFGF